MEIFISLNCISIDFLFVFMSDAQLSRFIQWFKTSVLNSYSVKNIICSLTWRIEGDQLNTD